MKWGFLQAIQTAEFFSELLVAVQPKREQSVMSLIIFKKEMKLL